ncbi:hypothetical protein DPMN_189821 [Dreissena polymorpha]|uniref:Uncharacterized protein n=1 Tax=Dreissena polymorpha TaxID=45954 RepID=A0A9D4DW65_DREPO|nr:hypothetical protein DPMN_189821 [Dreissena polymorpha]
MQAKALLKEVKERLLEAYENIKKAVCSSIAEKKEQITSQKQTECVQQSLTEVERKTYFVNQKKSVRMCILLFWKESFKRRLRSVCKELLKI